MGPSTVPGTYWLLLASADSIHQESSLFFCQSSLNRARVAVCIACLSLLIPSARNHLFLPNGIFNRARMMFGIAGLPVAIPSTRNHYFLQQGTLNRAMLMLCIVCLPLIFHSPEIILVYGTKIIYVIAGLPLTIPFMRLLSFSYNTS